MSNSSNRGNWTNHPRFYEQKKAFEAANGSISTKEFLASHFVIPDSEINSTSESGTSIFDPVLCEICYKWFCTEGGTIIDPFAGGSVRGIVAAYLGYTYIGIDLRAEQIEANRQQAATILAGREITPVWVTGNSRNIDKHCAKIRAKHWVSINACLTCQDGN